jgi:hypothetical protein
MFQNSSKIFTGYRALGVNSDHVPCVIRYNRKHQETYVITSIGKAFHVYKVFNFSSQYSSKFIIYKKICFFFCSVVILV